jgi:hypothetical protein
MTTEIAEKIFTLHEAEKTLPLARVIVDDIIYQLKKMRQLAGKVDQVRRETLQPDAIKARLEIARLETEGVAIKNALCDLKEELEDLGINYPSYKVYQLEWPSRIAGEHAILVWQHGEKTVRWWRRPQDSITALRQLMPTV